ncbi:MAG: hypothetical protein ACO3GP_09430 [Candidatus Limnocylindrus sp.]|jgi:hypothetical protein
MVTTYRFRNNPGYGCRYSVYVERFVTASGVSGVLEWFHTLDEALAAADEMRADGRFLGIHSYVRSQETADAEWGAKRMA